MSFSTDNSITWNNDLIFKLIDLYHERPQLWDTNLRENKDKQKKNDAWAEIAAAMGTDKDAVERKIKILSTQFRREIVKNDNDESKWFAFKKLMFLKPRVLKALADTESNGGEVLSKVDGKNAFSSVDRTALLTQGGEVLSKVDGKNAFSSVDRTALLTQTRDDDWCTSQSSAGTSTPQIRVKRMRLSETESEDTTKTEETYRIMTELYRERFSRDEFTVFGEHVAMKLRKLDNLYARCTAQYHINNILYRAEIGEYDTLEDKPYLG